MEKHNTKFSWPLIGNRPITEYLEKCVLKGRLPGAFIFNGPENLGKTTFAIRLAKIILCRQSLKGPLPCGECPACLSFRRGEEDAQNGTFSYSDFYLVKKDRDKQNLGIEQIRGLIRSVNMSSFLGSYKIGIVKNADQMSLEAANALLKTLEEPKDKVVLILATDQLERLPLTIKSRAQVLNFKPVKSGEIYDYLVKDRKAGRSQARDIANIAAGRPALAVRLLEEPDLLKAMQDQAAAFLDFSRQGINERLASLEALIEDKESGPAAKRKSTRVIEVWQAVVRDMLLYKNNHINLTQFAGEEKLRKAEYSDRQIIYWYELLENAKRQLAGNVNHKYVLENIAIMAGD